MCLKWPGGVAGQGYSGNPDLEGLSKMLPQSEPVLYTLGPMNAGRTKRAGFVKTAAKWSTRQVTERYTGIKTHTGNTHPKVQQHRQRVKDLAAVINATGGVR